MIRGFGTQKLKLAVAGSAGIKGIQTGLSILLTVVLARLLDPAGYGAYAFAFAVVTVLVLPATLGLQQLVLRETARAADHSAWGLMRGLWGWAGRRVVAASLLLALLLVTAAWGWLQPPKATVLLAGAALLPLLALGNLVGAALQGLQHPLLAQVAGRVARPALFLGAALGLYLGLGVPAAPDHAMVLHGIAAALALALGLGLLARYKPLPRRRLPKPEVQPRRWRAAAWPLMFSGGTILLIQQADLILLGFLRPQAEAGLYRVAMQGAFFVTVGSQAINAVMAPRLVSLHTQGRRSQLQRLLTLSARGMAGFALPVLALYGLAGETVLTLVFGSAYAATFPALMILAGGRLLHAAFGPAGVLLNMTGHERPALRAGLFAAGANLLLNALLIPPFGFVGAAAATTVSLGLWNVLLWRAARWQLGVTTTILGR